MVLWESRAAAAAGFSAIAVLLRVPSGFRRAASPDPAHGGVCDDLGAPDGTEAAPQTSSQWPLRLAVGAVVLLLLLLAARRAWLRRRRAQRRAQWHLSQRAFADYVLEGSGEPLKEWDVDSAFSLYVLWRGAAACEDRGSGSCTSTLSSSIVFELAPYLLEPRVRGPHVEALERLPPHGRKLYHLDRVMLGTPLVSPPLSRRLRNAAVWEAKSGKSLAAALPSGAFPWGAASSGSSILGIWCGEPCRYLPECPSGPPVIKLPVGSLTAVDCQNRDVRLEFSFEEPGGPARRPAGLAQCSGALLLLRFSEGVRAVQEVGAFLQELDAAARGAGAKPEVVPGLPNSGGLVPSLLYCRRSRQAAELGWAALNIVFLTQPLLQIWRLGILSLGIDGLVRLFVSRPGVAFQPLMKVVQRIQELQRTRLRAR
mmetsp:Transcript_60756/g.131751  ORF Transcript_60756/g.131751 Transcript_60756/m.131751 type:complete len:426 (-) Transcript_60756:182-1459(-)